MPWRCFVFVTALNDILVKLFVVSCFPLVLACARSAFDVADRHMHADHGGVVVLGGQCHIHRSGAPKAPPGSAVRRVVATRRARCVMA